MAQNWMRDVTRVTPAGESPCCDGPMVDADRAIQRVAQSQHGFVSRDQCLAAGLSVSQVKTRVRTQGWTRYTPGVFLLPGIRASVEGRLQAAQLWGGTDSILSHASAAWLHRIDDRLPSTADLYVTSGKSTGKVRCHRLKIGDSPETVRRRGLLFTRVERTLSDLAGSWRPKRLGEATDSALRQGLTTLNRLQQEADHWSVQGRAGSASFRQILRGRDPRDAAVRSEFETRTLRAIKPIKDWSVVPNHLVTVSGSRYYLDLAFPPLKVGVECQSVRWHLGDEALKNDAKRFRRLGLAGWLILPSVGTTLFSIPSGSAKRSLAHCGFAR